MGAKPNWLARFGTLVICCILGIILLCSYFIKYPETIITTAKLSGTNAPKPVLVYQSGKLVHLWKHNGTNLKAHELIGCIETTADYLEVLHLASRIDSLYISLDNNNTQSIENIMSFPYNHLGELQSDFQTLTQAYIPYRNYVIGGYADRKKRLLQNDIHYINQSKVVFEQQSKLYNQDISLSQTNLDNNQKLLKDNIISEQEYRELMSINIGKKMSLPQMENSLINASAQQNDKQKEILELNNQVSTQKALFKEAVYNFKSKIDSWKHNYLLASSISGTLSFTTFLQENQVVEAGKVVAFVNPEHTNYYLQASVPQNNLGKIKVGQKVLLQFQAWQWQEYGTLIGKVVYISNIASDSGYMTQIALPNGLITNKGRAIIYKEGLTARAEIITKDIRLSQRFYYEILKNVRRE